MRKWKLKACFKDGHLFGTMISGFIVGIVAFAMGAVGPQLFPYSEVMYPARNEQGLPPDTIALLQLNGVKTEEWPALSPIVMMAPGTEEIEPYDRSRSRSWPMERVEGGPDDSWCRAVRPQARSVELGGIKERTDTRDVTHPAC